MRHYYLGTIFFLIFLPEKVIFKPGLPGSCIQYISSCQENELKYSYRYKTFIQNETMAKSAYDLVSEKQVKFYRNNSIADWFRKKSTSVKQTTLFVWLKLTANLHCKALCSVDIVRSSSINSWTNSVTFDMCRLTFAIGEVGRIHSLTNRIIYQAA